MSLNLDNLTLFCLDTRSPDLAAWAIKQCHRHARFAKTVLMTDLRTLQERHPDICYEQAPEIHSVADYSMAMLNCMPPHIEGSHALVIQWDGFIINPSSWTPEFLDYDYIGAVWPQHPETPVGNGGFSLRSRRLLEALSDTAIIQTPPEDECIAIHNRDLLETKHHIRFAPTEVAERFSTERTAWQPSFGFHGFFNFANALDRQTLAEFIDHVPAACCGGIDSYQLLDDLLSRGEYEHELAEQLFSKCRFHWRRRREYIKTYCALRGLTPTQKAA